MTFVYDDYSETVRTVPSNYCVLKKAGREWVYFFDAALPVDLCKQVVAIMHSNHGLRWGADGETVVNALNGPREIEINARRWNDSVGNTYFTARVYVNGALAVELPFQYGYGSCYQDVAFKELIERGYLGHSFDGAYWSLCQKAGINLITSVEDVKRKKDLHNGGRK